MGLPNVPLRKCSYIQGRPGVIHGAANCATKFHGTRQKCARCMGFGLDVDLRCTCGKEDSLACHSGTASRHRCTQEPWRVALGLLVNPHDWINPRRASVPTASPGNVVSPATISPGRASPVNDWPVSATYKSAACARRSGSGLNDTFNTTALRNSSFIGPLVLVSTGEVLPHLLSPRSGISQSSFLHLGGGVVEN